ncbi:MAG: creatininase family protein [bacterium]|nr:creatininase family protein [bacterium]
MRIDYATWPQVEEYLKRDNRIIVPLGSIEQHGRAVATGIDYLIPQAIAERAADELDVLCTPPMPFGCSLHHAAFPGTISLRPTTYIALLGDLFEFLYRQGFRRIYCLNGHGGNVPAMKAAASEIAYRLEGIRIYPYSCSDFEEVALLCNKFFGDDEGSHVTPAEVSLLMFLHPELVGDLSGEVKTEPGLIKWHPAPGNWKEYYPTGNVGSDPKLASAEFGEKLFDAAVRGFKELLDTD